MIREMIARVALWVKTRVGTLRVKPPYKTGGDFLIHSPFEYLFQNPRIQS